MTDSDTAPGPAAPAAAGRLGLTIKRAEQTLIARKTQALREFDLTVPQYSVLLLLSGSSGMSAAQLARECMVTPQTMSTVLANLEKHGLIARSSSELHQKVVVNRATEAGQALVRRADRAALRVEGALSGEFAPDELALFESFLERAVRVLGELA
ncbi:MarR family winged helix-turn-helix transcriptional regulator [Kitasatospora sp. MBT63]|uniref:MarR family winged helix-turn-helix transcriptional regulator n=1 Tax=Kitasatospora sp. MBT63 TaxID=1444768 RepID=UPI00053A0BA2|nr:MarR family transcriptional regulator [Kitasatospora sp. MBT63]